MSEHLCEVEQCPNPAPYSAVCDQCRRKLQDALGSIPALAEELQITLTRQDAIGGGNVSRKAAESPLPFHAAASEARWVLRSTLAGWVRVLAEEGR